MPVRPRSAVTTLRAEGQGKDVPRTCSGLGWAGTELRGHHPDLGPLSPAEPNGQPESKDAPRCGSQTAEQTRGGRGRLWRGRRRPRTPRAPEFLVFVTRSPRGDYRQRAAQQARGVASSLPASTWGHEGGYAMDLFAAAFLVPGLSPST